MYWSTMKEITQRRTPYPALGHHTELNTKQQSNYPPTPLSHIKDREAGENSG